MAKSQSSQTSSEDGHLFALLEGQPCPACSEGKLERGTYKDNHAVICDRCETPRVQVWQPTDS